MKKKKLFLFMALTSTIAGLTSCNVSNDNNSTNIVEQTTTTSTSSQAPVYNLEDNELSQKVFNEIKKTLPNITYDEFLLYGRKIDVYSDHIVLEYSSIRISIALDGTFRSKYEYTYDANGNQLTRIRSDYKNNEWIKTNESIYINGEAKTIFLLCFNPDDTFSSKYEYTYDEKGNELSYIRSVYENNAWVYTYKIEYTYDANGKKSTEAHSKYENNAWVYTLKFESTYDEKGKLLTFTNSIYKKNAWVYIDKSEYTYDANGKMLQCIHSEYENNAWVYIYKYEYTYYESGDQSTKTYEYIDGNWVLQD